MAADKPSPSDAESFGHSPVRVATAAIEVAAVGDEPEAVRAPPSQPTRLHATKVASTSVDLAWTASTGSGPIAYTVFFRLYGAEYWSVGAVSSVTNATVLGLKSDREYEFEVMAHYV